MRLSKRSTEQVVQEAAVDFPAYYQQQPLSQPEQTGPIVVTGIDCKGVPMIKDEVMASVVEEVKRVDPTGSKTHLALCDGERALQKRILPALQAVVPGVVLILDLLHAVAKLWKVAHCFCEEGSEEATAWVRKQTLRMLEGKVSQVIKGMRHSATVRGLKGAKRETVDKVAAYLRRNRMSMK